MGECKMASSPEWVWRVRQEQGWETTRGDFYAESYLRNYDRTGIT